MDVRIKGTTVNLIAKLLHPLAEAGVLSIPEEREVIAQLRNLAKNGETIPAVLPKLIDQPEAAEMLGISLANFKKLERNGAFPFDGRRSAQRYDTAIPTSLNSSLRKKTLMAQKMQTEEISLLTSLSLKSGHKPALKKQT